MPFVKAAIPEAGPAIPVPASAYAGSEQLAETQNDAGATLDLMKLRQHVLGEERGFVPCTFCSTRISIPHRPC